MTAEHFNKAAPPSRNRLVWLCVLTAIVLVGIVFGVRIYVDYIRTISRSEERLLIQTKVVDENITTNLTVVNVMLNSIINELEGAPAKKQLNRSLKQLLVMTPGIRILVVTDQQGRCVYSNRDELLGKDFPRDRDYFTIPRDASDKRMLFLSSPSTTVLGKYVVNITKPRIGTRGEFKGVVTATLDPEYFSSLLSSTISTADNRVSLVHSDGTVFIAVPEAKIPVIGIKVTQPGSAFLQHISGGSATTIRRAPGKTLGDQRIFVYRTNTPQGVQFDKRIVVAASRNLHEILSTWRMDAVIELLIYLLFSSVSIVITELLLRRGNELKRLEDTRAHLAAIVQFSDDAIISKDLDGVILSWNSGAERLFGYPQEEVIGRPITILLPPEQLEEEKRILQQLNSGESVEHVETVRIAKDGRPIEVSVTSSPLKDSSGKVIGVSKIIRDISDHKLTVEALQESRHDLDRAQEVGKIGCWRLDVRSNVLTWSDENHRIFGIPKESPLSYESFLGAIHPDDRPYVDAQWQAGLRGEPYDIEHRLLVAGQVKWVREKAYLEFEKDGSLIGGFGITQEITQRKLAEEALLKAHAELEQRVVERTTDLAKTVEALLAEIGERKKVEASLEKTTREIEDLYNLAPCGYHSLDKDGTFIRINDTELQWIGYTRDEVIGKMKFTEILTPKSQDKFHENFPVFMKSGERSNMRYEFVHKNGTVFPILLNASAITDDNGAYIMSRSSAFDITELTQAQNSLQRLNSLYAVLSETNQTIVRSATGNRSKLFSEFCRIAVEHGGFLLAWIGVVDDTSGEVRRVAAYGRTSYLEEISITATDEATGEGPTGITIRNGTYFISNDFQNDPCTTPWHERGKVHGIYASASVALKEEGRVTGALTIYAGEKEYFDKQQVELLHQMGMDISYALENFNREARRLEAEQSLQLETAERLRTLETLREKEQLLLQQSRQAAMGEMIGNIAHQWRQPLNTLGLYTQRLGFFFGTPQFNKEFLDRSVAKSMEIIQHMSKTIDDFRNYFKPEKEKTDFYAIEAINNTLSLLDGNLQNPKIIIEIDDRDTPVINGYKNEFAQVLLNLLVNARDALIEREIKDGRIAITVISENGGTVVTVADNAGGIPEEIISKIFDPYFTTKGPQHGTGVGLFMSKTIIEKNMGGRLTVRNTADGAEFRIEIENGEQN